MTTSQPSLSNSAFYVEFDFCFPKTFFSFLFTPLPRLLPLGLRQFHQNIFLLFYPPPSLSLFPHFFFPEKKNRFLIQPQIFLFFSAYKMFIILCSCLCTNYMCAFLAGKFVKY